MEVERKQRQKEARSLQIESRSGQTSKVEEGGKAVCIILKTSQAPVCPLSTLVAMLKYDAMFPCSPE